MKNFKKYLFNYRCFIVWRINDLNRFFGKFKLPLLLMVVTPALGACATVMEAKQAYDEKPSMEMVLDRINTAARTLELEDIMLRTMPISAASTWPKDANHEIPKGDQSKLMGIVLSDAIFSPGSGFRPSAIRIKVMYQQTIFFESYPDMYYERKYMDKLPSNDEINDYGQKILGSGYNPVFNKSFVRFLRYTPDFKPKKSHFEGKLNGKTVEFYPSLEDAVISLADNAEQLQKIRNDMMDVDADKKRALRDIADTAREIKVLKDKKTAPAEIKAFENQIPVYKKEYDTAALKYETLLKAWKIELTKIKQQATAFNDEQLALAANIQSGVSAIKGLHTDAVVLVTISAMKLPSSIMNLPAELSKLTTSPKAGLRIARIYLNMVSLSENVSIIKKELAQTYAEAIAMDGLFDNRIKTVTSPQRKTEK